MKAKLRDSRFELLRIFAMLLIVAHHFAYHGLCSPAATSISLNVFLNDFFIVGGKIGVNIFILISGYFLIDSKFRFSKLIKLILQIFTYSIVIYLALLIFGYQQFTWNAFIRSCLPTLTNQYWFATCYILMYIISPFINACLNNISKKQHFILIIILITFGSILFYLPYISTAHMSNLGWFITVYSVGAYISKYSVPYLSDGTQRSKLLTIIVSIIVYLIIFIGYGYYDKPYHNINHIFCLSFSILVFITFKNLFRIKNIKWINIISSATFGVYLIHDNIYLRKIIWNNILNSSLHFTYNEFWIYSIVAIASVFIVCIIIELLRIYLIENPTIKIYNNLKNKKTQN